MYIKDKTFKVYCDDQLLLVTEIWDNARKESGMYNLISEPMTSITFDNYLIEVVWI